MHYSLRTEQTYVYWIRWFIRYSGLRHPKDMGRPEVEAFLTMLATERNVAVLKVAAGGTASPLDTLLPA
jgi:hypothetical protein